MSDLPISNSEYSRLEYWNDRYAKEDNFDWCKKYSDFQHLIRASVKPEDKILILGCGNSSLSEDMYRDGFHNITNIDYSNIVIDNMKQRSEEARAMPWLVMDINNLTFEPESFDVIIEKATLDALLVNEKDPWHMSEDAQSQMNNILSKVSELLRSGGRFISITFAQPHFRKRLYAQPRFHWSIATCTFGSAFHFYLYVMTKGQSLGADDLLLARQCERNQSAVRTTTFLERNDQDDFLNCIDIDS